LSSAVITGKQRQLLAARYDIEVDAHGDFFEAYVAALRRALEELWLDNDALAEAVSDLYRSALKEVYGFEP